MTKSSRFLFPRVQGWGFEKRAPGLDLLILLSSQSSESSQGSFECHPQHNRIMPTNYAREVALCSTDLWCPFPFLQTKNTSTSQKHDILLHKLQLYKQLTTSSEVLLKSTPSKWLIDLTNLRLFYASVLLLLNCVITLSKWLWNQEPQDSED